MPLSREKLGHSLNPICEIFYNPRYASDRFVAVKLFFLLRTMVSCGPLLKVDVRDVRCPDRCSLKDSESIEGGLEMLAGIFLQIARQIKSLDKIAALQTHYHGMCADTLKAISSWLEGNKIDHGLPEKTRYVQNLLTGDVSALIRSYPKMG